MNQTRIQTQTGIRANTRTGTGDSTQARTAKTLAQTKTESETQTKRTVGDALSDPRGILHKTQNRRLRMNAPKTIHKTGKLTGLFLRACSVRLHERLAAWFLLPLQAKATAPQSAVEHPQFLSAGRRSRPGLAWLRALFGLPALMALLVAAGLSAEVKAQTAAATVNPDFVCQGETKDLAISGTAPFEVVQYVVASSGAGVRGTAWRALNSDGTVNTANVIIGLGGLSGTYSTTLRVQNISADGSVTLTAFNASPITINFHPSSHASCASADGVTLSQSALTLTELGSSSDVKKTYTVVLDTDPGANVVVTVASNDTTVVAVDTDSDTAGDQDTLTFTTSNWNAAQTVTLRALNDGDALAETVTISHAAAVSSDSTNPYHQIPIDNVTATTVDAGHGVAVSKASVSATVGGATGTYTIALKSQPGGNVVVTPSSSATARATVSGALTFTTGNWSTPQTVTVTGVGAGSATISHMVTTAATDYPTTTTIASVTATVTAAANNAPTVANMIPDQPATVGTAFSYPFPANTFNDADGDGLTYTATQSGGSALPTWLTFTPNTRTFSGTPQAADVGTLSVTVTANDGNSGTVSDTFDITVSHPARNLDIQVADAYEGENIVVTLTLSRAPGNVSAAQRTIRVNTTVPSASNVNICIADHGCEDGSTPVAASDFTATTTNVMFGPTETVKTVSIPTATDSVSEGVEVVAIGISYAPPGASDLGIFTQGSTQITGRNAFNSGAPFIDPTSITVNSYGQILGDSRPVPITITEAGGTTVSEDGSTVTDSYTVVLDSAPSASVTVTATAGAGAQVQAPGGTAGTTATLTFTTSNWNQAQTITVTGVDDEIDNAGDARTVTIAHAASSTDSTYTIANAGEVRVTVTDDDTAGLVFSPDPVSVGEGATGSYTVALTSEPSASVTVTITGQGGSTDLTLDTNSGMAGDQNTLTFTTSNWSAAQTVMLTAAEDVDSANDSITLLHAPSGGGYGNSQNKNLAVTITDDEGLTPVISVSLPFSEGESKTDDGEKEVLESAGGTGIGFTVSADRQLASALTVCVRVTESGGDRVASGDEGIKTVSLTSIGMTNGSGTHTLTWSDTATDTPDSKVTVEVIAPNTNGCSATNGSYAVSTSDDAPASGKLLIKDEEQTTVELTSTDNTMIEGIASATATLTVRLSRQLYAGEVIAVPIALVTSTGARLPGSTDSGTANHDFTVAASGTEVTLANALTATPRVVFTGHGTNTVQTATVTLAPVASRSDGDSTPETITATLTSLGSTGLGTTVSGGVAAHSTNNMVSLTLAEPGTPGITLSTASQPLRLLETGTASYTVVLDAAPTHDVRVSVARIGAMLGAASTDHTILTFTTSDWSQAQTVTVTGVDESGTHRNRSLVISHGVNSTDTRYGNLSNTNLRVEVDDAPELEAWDTAVWTGSNRSPSQRPSTITTSNGFSHFRQDFSPGPSGLYYKLRLSNRPATGGTVTVMATSSDPARFRLALTPDGTPQPSLTVTFEDRDADPGCHNSGRDDIFVNEDGTLTPANGRVGDDRDNSPDTAWRCYRRIWVINMQALPAPSKGCSTISHTASGGGLRATYVGSIRAHTISNNGRSCPRITGTPEAGDNKNYNPPQNSSAQAAPAPTEAVANVQVTAVDDASASVTWDTVEHATSYNVSWSAESSDSQNASAGVLPGVTGTSATIQHDASVAMTLTVTVTPEYVDENGDTQQLDTLAGTATLEVGPQPLSGGGTSGDGDGGGVGAGEGDAQASATAACVSADLMQHVEARIEIAITDRWERIRNALIGQPNAITLAEVKEIYENRKANGWDTNRLEEVIAAMECIESAMQQSPVPDESPDPTPDPGPDPDPVPDPVVCVSPPLRSDVEGYSEETWQGSAHVERWLRVLQTFSGTANDTTVMTPSEAEGYVNRGWQRWVPVLEALKCMEQQALDSN